MSTSSDNIATPEATALGFGPKELAAITLIGTNVGMLVLFFALDLTLFQLVVVYWFEALWIGLFSGLKLLTASLFGSPYENRWVDVSPGGAFLLSLLAIAKSGGAFFTIFILTGVALAVANEGLTGVPGDDFASDQGMLLLKCSVLFIIGHGLSFLINFLWLGEFRRATIGTLLVLPFKRSLALFVTIVIALTVIQTWPGTFNTITFPVALILIKLGWDAFLHSRERRSLR